MTARNEKKEKRQSLGEDGPRRYLRTDATIRNLNATPDIDETHAGVNADASASARAKT